MYPKISIIVPIYNVEAYLKRCVDSLINQTLKDIEIILVDDESPDGCFDICEDYALRDERIKVIHKKNGGLGLARNSGLELARGEYIAFIDSDDWVDHTMYEYLYNTALRNGCDTVFCSLQYYYSQKHVVPFNEVKTTSFFEGRQEVDSFLLDMLSPLPDYHSDVKYLVSVCKAIYHRKLIENNKVRFLSEKKIASEDMLFHISYLRHAEKIGFLPNPFYNYFQNSSSITHTYTEAKIERLKAFIIEIEKMYSQYYPEKQYKLRLQRKVLHYFRTALSIKYQIQKDKSFIEQYKQLWQLCNDLFFCRMLSGFPYHQLNMKHRVFGLLVKYKLVLLLMPYLKIKN